MSKDILLILLILTIGVVFRLFTSFHPILFPFYLVFIVILLLKRRFPSAKIIALSCLAFLVPLFPLILFEYFHNFLEFKLLISLFSGNLSEYKNHLESFTQYLLVNLHEPYRIFGIMNIPRTYFSYTLFATLLLLGFKKIGFWKDNFHRIFPITTSVVFILYYTYYPGHVPEYYFSAIGVLVVLYTSASLSLLSKKGLPLLFLILIVISFFNIKILNERWNNPSLITLTHKDFIVKEILKRQETKVGIMPNFARRMAFDPGLVAHNGWGPVFYYRPR